MQKKIPLRLCTGCAQRKPKAELVRVVRTPEEKIVLDFTGKANGRGAYICKNQACLESAVKKKRLENTFGVQIPDEIYEALKKELCVVER